MFSEAWAKLDLENGSVLSVRDHGIDVAAVFEAFLDAGWDSRFKAIHGEAFSNDIRSALIATAFLHDMGKTNAGFWRRQFPGAPIVGHLTPLLAYSTGLEDVLGAVPGLLGQPDLCAALLAHHGRPVVSGRSREEELWVADERYDPLAQLSALIGVCLIDWPGGLNGAPPEIAPRAISLFAGLLTLADWIGSDPVRFPLDGVSGRVRQIRSRDVARQAVAGLGLGADEDLRARAEGATFESTFGFGPHPMQEEASEGAAPLTVLEAETGSGKTEAAIWRFLRLFAAGAVDGVYFALPTRTSAVQMEARLTRAMDAVFGPGAVPVTLAVPGYLRVGGVEGQRIGPWDVLWPDAPGEALRDARWAGESPKQFLAARVAVGTVDQVLMSGLKVRHAHLRAACLSRLLLVVDEVHASDDYMTEVLCGVLANHIGAGGHAMLLSATLGNAARARLTGQDALGESGAMAVPYPAFHAGASTIGATGGHEKAVRVDLAGILDDAEAIAARAIAAAEAGARVLVLRNTVRGALAVQAMLEKQADPALLWQVADAPALHHGRFAAEDRRLLDKEIEKAFGKDRTSGGLIAVGTQTLEISLDLDADLMITDLAPMDVLLQRFGRLHRHRGRARPAGLDSATAVVAVPSGRDLTRYLGRVAERHGLGPSGDDARAGVYANIVALEATWAVLEARPALDLPADNRALVEAATHPDALEAVVAAQSWDRFWAKDQGSMFAEVRQARDNSLDLSKPLETFPESETIATRLGARDRLVRFPANTVGPFGERITTVRVAAWMLRGVAPDADPEVRPEGDGLVLRFEGEEGQVTLRYDRLGLRVG